MVFRHTFSRGGFVVISFCTQILNRWWQIRQVVEENLRVLEGTPHEWVVLDLGSDDGLELPSHPNLRWIKVPRPDYYIMGRAKNQAKRLGSGQYLFSLDADNYIGQSTIDFIQANPNLPLHNFKPGVQGTHGRIGLPKKIFDEIGGYLEIHALYGEDIDYLERLRRHYPVLKYRECPTPIPNTLNDTQAFYKKPLTYRRH